MACRRPLLVASLLACLLPAAACADFTYESNISNVQRASGATASGFYVGDFGSTTSTTTPQAITLFPFAAFYSETVTTPESFAYSFTDTVRITNIPPGGVAATGNLALSILISYTDTTSTAQTNSITINGVAGGAGLTASVAVGGLLYTLSNFNFSPSTSTSAGTLTASVTTSAVPEPGSLALLGVAGALGLAGRARRRAWIAH